MGMGSKSFPTSIPFGDSCLGWNSVYHHRSGSHCCYIPTRTSSILSQSLDRWRGNEYLCPHDENIFSHQAGARRSN